MRVIGVFVWLAGTFGSTLQGSAQEGTDPRALEACKASASSFVEIAECLPDAHVAFKVLDAFDVIYPPEGAQLKTRCIEINEPVTSAAICVVDAIETAVSLSGSLPAGTALDDPVFNAVKAPDLLAALEAVQDEARSAFPEKSFWGGGMYHPY